MILHGFEAQFILADNGSGGGGDDGGGPDGGTTDDGTQPDDDTTEATDRPSPE